MDLKPPDPMTLYKKGLKPDSRYNEAAQALIGMIGSEIHIAKNAAPHEMWLEAEKDMNTALVMLNSGVAHDCGHHLTQALSKITTIGQQSMGLLVEKGLL